MDWSLVFGNAAAELISPTTAAYALAAKFDRQVMAEAFVSGREFTCALLELAPGQVVALPAIEIVAPEGKYDYQNKYFGTETRKICPAPIEDEVKHKM